MFFGRRGGVRERHGVGYLDHIMQSMKRVTCGIPLIRKDKVVCFLLFLWWVFVCLRVWNQCYLSLTWKESVE